MLIVIVILVLFVTVMLFMQQPQFGKAASGDHLERIKNSPNYRNGKFQNLSYTPDIKEGVSYYTVIKDFFLIKVKEANPHIFCHL